MSCVTRFRRGGGGGGVRGQNLAKEKGQETHQSTVSVVSPRRNFLHELELGRRQTVGL